MKKRGCCSVEIQNGPINPNIPVQKNMGTVEIAMQDYENRIGRKEGQTLTTHIPKTTVRKSLSDY